MKKFVFKSVFNLDSLYEFPEQLTYEVVCSKEEAPDIPSILDKFGYVYPDVELGDEGDDFDLDIENDFDYDIIDAYEESASFRVKRKEAQGTNSQQNVASHDNKEEEAEIEEQRDDEGGTNEEESAN